MTDRTLRWLALALEDLKAHSPEDVPACEHAMACVRERGALETENAELRKTNARLHRRCQSAERGLEARLTSGVSFGRALANSAAVMWRDKHADLRLERDALLKAAQQAGVLLKDVYEFRADKAIAEDERPFNVCDYYRFEDVLKQLRAAIAAAEGQPRDASAKEEANG